MSPSDHPDSASAFSDDDSSRSLDDVGAAAVVDAMDEHLSPALDDDDSDAVATQRIARIAPGDDVFQKIR